MSTYTLDEIREMAVEKEGPSQAKLYHTYKNLIKEMKSGGLKVLCYAAPSRVEAQALARYGKVNELPIYHVAENCITIGETFKDLYEHEIKR